MQDHEPEWISATERRARVRRLKQIARRLGFVGRSEYRHVSSRSGGAQYCIGPSAENDLLVIYAEAFERDADPDDFSLEAIIAHERGHQLIEREYAIRAIFRSLPSDRFEEFLASLIGYLLLGDSDASRSLRMKATMELVELRMPTESIEAFVDAMLKILRRFL